MKRFRDRFTTIRNSAATCRYFYREVTAQRHSYPLILLLSVLAGAVSPFINIIVPPCIIDELMGGTGDKKADSICCCHRGRKLLFCPASPLYAGDKGETGGLVRQGI